MLTEFESFENICGHSCGLGHIENKLECLYHARVFFSFGRTLIILGLLQQMLFLSPTDMWI